MFQRSDAMVSLVDIVPTVLDWFSIPYPNYSIFKNDPAVKLTGRSLLPILSKEPPISSHDTVYASHSLHEITMYYPIRVIRTRNFKLVHNLNYLMPFPIDEDFYLSPTFQDLLNRTRARKDLHWFSSLKRYYYRDAWELYDLAKDPFERNNLYQDSSYTDVFHELQTRLNVWQNVTRDPWICGPGAVLEDGGIHKQNPQCMGLENGLVWAISVKIHQGKP